MDPVLSHDNVSTPDPKPEAAKSCEDIDNSTNQAATQYVDLQQLHVMSPCKLLLPPWASVSPEFCCMVITPSRVKAAAKQEA